MLLDEQAVSSVKNGFAEPRMVNQCIRSYKMSDLTRDNEKIKKKTIRIIIKK